LLTSLYFFNISSGVFDSQNSGHVFSFYAAPVAGSGDSGVEDVLFNVTRTGADGLQMALYYSLGAVYFLSAVLYFLSFIYLKIDRKALVEVYRNENEGK
jgi:hypothetical protein